MLKFLPLAKPRDGLTAAESQDHLRYEHSRLCVLDPAFHRHEPKYVQNFIFCDGVGPDHALATDYSSVAENVFYSRDSFTDAYAEPSYARMREDEVRFATFEDLLLVATTPSVIFAASPRDSAFKVWRFSSFRAGADVARATKAWETGFAAAVQQDARIRSTTEAYVQDRVVRDLDNTFPEAKTCDAVDEYWISSLDVLPEFLEAEHQLRADAGLDDLFDAGAEIRFVSETKLVWDHGEDPRSALSRIRRWR
jgi:hypothetical protein